MRNIATGTSLRSVLRADDWNQQQRVLRSVPPMTEIWGASEFESPHPNYEYVVNNSAETFGFGDVIAIERCLNRFSAQRPDNKVSKGRLVFEAYRITDDDQENVGILLQELRPGELGKCVVNGACLANVEVTDLGHRYAKIKDGKLESVGDEGMFVLLDQVPEVGQHLIPVRFNCKGKQGVVMLGEAQQTFIFKLHNQGTWSRVEFKVRLEDEDEQPVTVDAYCHKRCPYNIQIYQKCLLFFDQYYNKTLFYPIHDSFPAFVIEGTNGSGYRAFKVLTGDDEFWAITDYIPGNVATAIFPEDYVNIATKMVWAEDNRPMILNPTVDSPMGTIRATMGSKPRGWDWCDGQDGRPNLQEENRIIVGVHPLMGAGRLFEGSWEVEIPPHQVNLPHQVWEYSVYHGDHATVVNHVHNHLAQLDHTPVTLYPPRIGLVWIIRTH